MIGQSVELVATHHPGAGEIDPTSEYWEMRWPETAAVRPGGLRRGGVADCDPVVKAKTPIYEYEPNSWGPAEVDKIVVPPGGWQKPETP